MQNKIEQLCRTLKIGYTISNNYQTIQADTHEDFLIKILQLAVEDREVNRINRLLKQARFPVFKTFETYCFEDIQIPEKLPIPHLTEGEFIQRNENLILYGGVGAGKTHMAIAIGVNLINQGKKVLFYKTHTLVNEAG